MCAKRGKQNMCLIGDTSNKQLGQLSQQLGVSAASSWSASFVST